MPAWAARCYEPLLGGILAGLRTTVADCCAHGLSGGRVLDVCCGPGGLRPYLQQRGLTVTGVDLDRHMLREAVRRKQAQGVQCSSTRRAPMPPDTTTTGSTPPGRTQPAPMQPPTLWALADARQLPFAEGSFDAAVVCLALHAVPWNVATAVLAEMRRVAQRVVVADYCLPERNLTLPSYTLAFAVERLVGGKHYRCYREFLHRGGLEGLLYSQGIPVARREHTLGGAGMVSTCGV